MKGQGETEKGRLCQGKATSSTIVRLLYDLGMTARVNPIISDVIRMC